MISVTENQQKQAIAGTGMVNFAVYKLLLEGNLSYFGIQDMPYHMTNTTREDTLVISTWMANKDVETTMVKFQIAQYNKKLYSLVAFNESDKIIFKQFYENYINVSGLAVPTEIISFYYMEEGESVNWLKLTNIKVNNFDHNENYTHTIFEFL